jgi:hypothetical protein
MKKLLMTSAVLFLFSASIMMFQISCSKTANAGNTSINNTASKIVYLTKQGKIGIKNADGTGTTSIITPILPSGFALKTDGDTDIDSDGTHIFFVVNSSTSSGTFLGRKLFRCDLSGNNVLQVVSDNDVEGPFTIY